MSDDITLTSGGDTPKFYGICDECLGIRPFGTAQERDLWERHHPHYEAM